MIFTCSRRSCPPARPGGCARAPRCAACTRTRPPRTPSAAAAGPPGNPGERLVFLQGGLLRKFSYGLKSERDRIFWSFVLPVLGMLAEILEKYWSENTKHKATVAVRRRGVTADSMWVGSMMASGSWKLLTDHGLCRGLYLEFEKYLFETSS